MQAKLKVRLTSVLRRAVKGLRNFAYARRLPGQSPKSIATTRRPRVGLALGGGFARGLAHLGVLKVLVENNIPVDALAGTSVGSVVAAAYASGCTMDEMLAEARAVRWSDIASWTIPRLGFATNVRMEAMLQRLLRRSRFEELSLPLSVVATDVSTGQAVVFREGELFPPVRASCSFPGLFVPVSYQGRLLVDGAIVGSVPVGALQQMGVDVIVAVHLKTGDPSQAPTNVFQVVGQAFQIVASLSQTTWRRACDVVIEPDVGGFRWDDFGQVDELISAGERAARQALPALRALLNPARPLAVPRLLPAR